MPSAIVVSLLKLRHKRHERIAWMLENLNQEILLMTKAEQEVVSKIRHEWETRRHLVDDMYHRLEEIYGLIPGRNPVKRQGKKHLDNE